jgi:hypothetical protein
MPRCNRVPTVRPGVAFALAVAAWSSGGDEGADKGGCGADVPVACSNGYGGGGGGRRGPGSGSTR